MFATAKVLLRKIVINKTTFSRKPHKRIRRLLFISKITFSMTLAIDSKKALAVVLELT